MAKFIFLSVAFLYFCSTAVAQKAISSTHGTLIVKEGTAVPLLPLASFNNPSKVKNSLRLRVKPDESQTSTDVGQPYVDSSGVAYLTGLNPGPFNTLTQVDLLYSGKSIVSFKVFSTNQELFNFIGQNPSIYINAILGRGENWYLIDETKIAANSTTAVNNAVTTMAAPSSDSGIDQVIADPENGGGSFYPRSVCFRFYNPVPGTVNHSGIQVWQINNPIPAGFSLKNESPNFSMRCPNSNYRQQENFVDGLYRRSWGAMAFKIPDHCTSVRQPGNSFCCCNAAMSAAFGTCRYLNTPSYFNSGWPTYGLTCR